MVYDDAGNYIDGKHRQNEASIIEGDEFQLDKGVLVQVEEQQQTTHQDLTELVKQKKFRDSQENADETAKAASGRSAVDWRIRDADSTAPRFKSIKEVLSSSTPRNRGLARPTAQPQPRPAPARQIVAPEPVERRPAKRQRLDPAPGPAQTEITRKTSSALSRKASRTERSVEQVSAVSLTDSTEEAQQVPKREERRKPAASKRAEKANIPVTKSGYRGIAEAQSVRQSANDIPSTRDFRIDKAHAAEQEPRAPAAPKLKGRLQLGSSRRPKLMCVGGPREAIE